MYMNVYSWKLFSSSFSLLNKETGVVAPIMKTTVPKSSFAMMSVNCEVLMHSIRVKSMMALAMLCGFHLKRTPPVEGFFPCLY